MTYHGHRENISGLKIYLLLFDIQQSFPYEKNLVHNLFR